MGFMDALRLSTMFNPTKPKVLNTAWQNPVTSDFLAPSSKPSPWSGVGASFGDASPIQPEEFQADPQQEAINSYLARMKAIEESGTPALDKYRAHLAATPTYDENKPGKLGTLAAILSGAGQAMLGDPSGAVDTVQKIKNLKYNMALNNWSLKGKGLKEESDLEIEAQRDRMKNLQEGMKYDLENRKFDDTSRRGWYTAETGRTTAEGNLRERGRANDIAARRNDIYGQQVGNTAAYQRGQLGLGAARNRTYADSVANSNTLGQERNKILRERIGAQNGKRVSQQQIQMAEDAVLAEMMRDPTWKKGVKELGKDRYGLPILGVNTNNPDFQAEFKSRVQKRLNYGIGAFGMMQNPQDDNEDPNDAPLDDDEWDIK